MLAQAQEESRGEAKKLGMDYHAVIQLLLAAGANVNGRDNAGKTPLMSAFTGEVTAWLLELGANPQLKDKRGKTALDWAKERRHDSARRVLEEAMEKRG